MLLSILIPSLESRAKQLNNLLSELNTRYAQLLLSPNIVEILTLVDNKEITTGAKRNALLQMAKGEYIVFIDDDDYVYPSYLSEIIKGCKTGADCLSIQGLITTDGKKPIKWQIGKDFKDETVKRGGKPFYLRHTNHLAPVKREIALQCGFPDKSNAEDSWYSNRLRESGLLKTEYKVEPLLYHYKFQTSKTTVKEYK